MPTVLLPLDGTPVAEIALAGLQALAGEARFMVRLLYVGDDDGGERSAYLEQEAERLRRRGHDASTLVLAGDPATDIVGTAHGLPADFVILKRDQRAGNVGWIRGSVTDHVARHLRIPLLLMSPLPGDGRWLHYKIRRVMVPLDGSGNAELAIDQALPIAERLGAQLSVMYSVPWLEASNSAAPELIAVGSVGAATDARLEADMATYLQDVIARFRDKLRLQTVAMRA